MKKLHYSKEVRRKMTGRESVRRRRLISKEDFLTFCAVSFMALGFLAALFLRILL